MQKLFLVCVSCVLCMHNIMAQDIVGMVKKVKPAVVTIVRQNSFGLDDGLGSGFFVSPTRIVTNHHVVDGSAGLKIILNDSSVIQVAKIIAADSVKDLALLELSAAPKRTIQALTLKATLPEQGERVYLVGNPLGLEQSVTDGIVSSIRVMKEYGTVIQMTAAMSNGNSGSPLLNASGEVLGVACFLLKGGQNLNFAIPIEEVQKLKSAAPLPFVSTHKKYEGVDVNISDAFSVDTTWIANAPAGLSIPDQTLWKLKLTALRQHWDTAMVSGSYNRVIRAIKRVRESFNVETDTISMMEAEIAVKESFGSNDGDDRFNPEQKVMLYNMREIQYASVALMFTHQHALPVGRVSDLIGKRAQVWQQLRKGGRYVIISTCDSTKIADLDAVIMYKDASGKWQAVASDTDEGSTAVLQFVAPETTEYAIVWRVARFVDQNKNGIFGSITFRVDD